MVNLTGNSAALRKEERVSRGKAGVPGGAPALTPVSYLSKIILPVTVVVSDVSL
jgi:hypothetical protein